MAIYLGPVRYLFAAAPYVLFQDVCSAFPCEEGETCLRRGGVACFGGCEADDLRICGESTKVTLCTCAVCKLP